MGRKIPAKKHRGVKDPLVQQARREKILKSKINAPPKDPDEQPIPKSLTRLFAFQNKINAEEKPKKKTLKRLQHHETNKSGVGDNPISRLHKLPGESGRGFSLRINSAVKALHGEVTEDDYYPQDQDDEDIKGERMADFKQYRAKKLRRATGGRKPEPTETKLTRTQKQALKKRARQEKEQETLKERQEVVYERVSFGDISHAPPTLNFRNKKLQVQPTGGAPRPGRRDLLLSKLLTGASTSPKSKSTGAPASASAAADAMRRERARLSAVQAYRDLKASRLKNNKNT